MPELAAGYAVRPATADDLDGILELFDAYDVWDFGRTDTVREHLEADWVAPGFDPALDTWLVTDDGGGVVAFASVQGMATEAAREAYGRVHPDHHGRGIGSFLVPVTEDRARARPGIAPAAVRNFSTSTDASARTLLEDHGYWPFDPVSHEHTDDCSGTVRYIDELRANGPRLRELRRRARTGALTLVYSAHDSEHNDAVVLAEVLRRGLPNSDRPR